jgi:predicted RNA-binding protein with TRAM domain
MAGVCYTVLVAVPDSMATRPLLAVGSALTIFSVGYFLLFTLAYTGRNDWLTPRRSRSILGVFGVLATGAALDGLTMQVTVESPSDDGGGGGGDAYNSSWILPSGDGIECENGTCVFDQNRSDSDELELTMETDPTADDANVEFAVNDTETASINSSSTDDRTSADGTASVTLSPLQDGSINAYTWSGGSGDTLPITFVNVSEEPFFDVTIADTNSPVTEGETLEVDVNVTNTGNAADTQTLNLTDTGFNGIEQDTVDVQLDPGQFNNSITLEWTTSSGDAGTGDVTVFSENDSDLTEVTVEEASGLSGIGATDIVPNASEQMQTFTFTISGEDLPSGETVVVDLDEPQATSPIQVDYSSASVNDVNDESSGGDASIDTNSGTGTLNYTASSGDVPAGTTVRIRVTSINAGGKSDQSDPYAIPISRTDFGVEDSTQFSVALQNGTAELEDFEVTDLVGIAPQEQTIRFTPTTEMDATGNGPEILTVDLSKAQDGTVDYSSASVQSTSTGSAGVNTDSNVAYLKFEADGGVTAGTEVEITIESVKPSSTGAPSTNETYETGFSRGAADTNSTTFNVCLLPSCSLPGTGGRERVQYRHTQSVIREFRPPSVDSSSIHTPRETYKSNMGCCFQPSQWLRQDIYGAKHTEVFTAGEL